MIVYKNPHKENDTVILGYKGSSYIEPFHSDQIYCLYIPITFTKKKTFKDRLKRVFKIFIP